MINMDSSIIIREHCTVVWKRTRFMGIIQKTQRGYWNTSFKYQYSQNKNTQLNFFKDKFWDLSFSLKYGYLCVHDSLICRFVEELKDYFIKIC